MQGLVDIFNKFEDPKCLHFYIATRPAATTVDRVRQRSMKVHLVRFELEFELRLEAGGELVFHSLDHRGYRLSNCQQLSDTLHGFTRYLLLEAIHPESTDMIGQPHQRLIVPATSVTRSGDAVETALPASSSVGIKSYVYNIHARFDHLTASSIVSRLHLAGLYAATSSFLPEQRTGMTGAEHAMVLVRQCWVNRPLSADESTALCTLSTFCNHAPAIVPLCDELDASSRQLGFLHCQDEDLPDPCVYASAGGPHACIRSKLYSNDAATEYAARTATIPTNYRSCLSDDEAARAFGVSVGIVCVHGFGPSASDGLRQLEPIAARPLAVLMPSAADGLYASSMESSLINTLTKQTASSGAAPSFPLSAGSHAALTTKIGDRFLDDLRDSWQVYHELPTESLAMPPAGCKSAVTDALHSVSATHHALEREIFAVIANVPVAGDDGGAESDCHWHAVGFRMLRASNVIPAAQRSDLVRCSWQPELLHHFNAFLSPASIKMLQEAILLWMQLCVLQDRLRRILSYLHPGTTGAAADTSLVVRELLTQRVWSVHQHPQWLAFEVEQGLQIRPEQHAIMMRMITGKSGTIDQLNMGLGKTRVIVPCLILHWADGSARTRSALGLSEDANIVRIYLLAQLLEEGFNTLHAMLCASVLGKKLFRLPFHRDVELDGPRARAILDALRHCQRAGGAVILAREHRLSMYLKWQEQQLSNDDGPARAALKAVVKKGIEALDALPYVDVFDESDEMLHHRRQLVYAVGSQLPLPEGPSRWNAIQAVLEKIRWDPSVRSVLERDGVSTTSDGSAHHAYDGRRLLPGSALEGSARSLSEAVMDALLRHPPRHFAWLHEHRNVPGLIAKVRTAVLDVDQPIDHTLKAEDVPEDSQFADVLALRGLLGHGILEHCLQKRHRVDYGIPRRPTDKKRLAVPFTAADTPSLRSEFAQPDCSLVFTVLAYYHDGLSRKELLEAF